MNGATAVLDIGKTNVKLETFAADGALLWERSTPNRIVAEGLYPHADVDKIWTFFLEALAQADRIEKIATIVATTHACTAALIDDSELTLPIMDYEFAGVEEIEPSYAAIRPPFSETLSPKLPAGLNLGRQLAWQKQRFPEAFGRAKYFLTYPQYWAWRLSGIAASEVTSFGAHTDLWAPLRKGPSSLVFALDLDRRMPPLSPAYRALGVISAEVAARTGLDAQTSVLCGIHDSNASLLPHLASRTAPFTIVSTGTWVILMAVGLGLERLNPADDMLANVDVEGRPVACGRFMGGREYAEIVAGAPAAPDDASLARVIASGAMALPCFAGQGGPFAARKGEIRGAVAAVDRPALATLYVALMSDLMLTRLGADVGDLIVEGSLAANPGYCQALAALRPSQPVYVASDAAGTARGAALLAQWPARNLSPPKARRVSPSGFEGLKAYCAAWTMAVVGS
jgi:sugar (pentulose or hexulose) kinase